MLVHFLVRLALGLVAHLFLLSPRRTARPEEGEKPIANASFFRTQLLVVLGLTIGAMLWSWSDASKEQLTCLGLAAACACLGSVSWSVEGSPGAFGLLVGALVGLGGAVWLREAEVSRFVGALSSAALLGAATSAMLMGHNYLVAPNLTMEPLNRLLKALAGALVLRALVEGMALRQWTAGHELATLTGDAVLWLPVRWVVGLALPAGLCWMAWQTARIRATQSATGILYVVVICSYVGEVLAQLLRPEGLSY